MKYFRLLLAGALLFLVGIGVSNFLTELEKPASGVVKIEAEKPKEETTEGTTAETVTVTETTVTPEVPEVVKPVDPKPEFQPLPFDGNTRAFAKKHGGYKYKFKDATKLRFFGKGYKAVSLPNGDIYVVTKKGDLFVIHNNKPIKL